MAGRRAIGKQRRRENRAKNLEALDLGDQHPEAFATDAHVFAPEPRTTLATGG